MIVIKPKTIKALKNGLIKEADFAQELVENYSAMDISKAFVELLAMKEVVTDTPIALNQDDYDRVMKLFRVKGLDVNGAPQSRGRKKVVKDIKGE